jgi:CHAD domain-containing protein
LPDEAPGVGIARREISLPGRATTVPPELDDLVRGWALGAPLVPVARLRTRRQRTTLSRPSGQMVAVIDDDEVSIVQRSRVAARFRELELELIDGAPPKLLKRLARRVRSAGAQPVDQIPKLVRALGPAALAPWDLAQPEVGKHPTAAEMIRGRLIASAASLVDHLAPVVLDEDREAIHQARVAIRRLRSDLRTARPLLEAPSVRTVRRELDWLMGVLGEVRDLDVLLERLRIDMSSLARADRAGAEDVLAKAREDREAAYQRLRAALRSPRCAELLMETSRVVVAPPFKRRAYRPAADLLPGLIRQPLRDLRRQARGQGESPDDDGLHRLRIGVKRVRYAAELVAPTVGKKACRAARGLAQAQDVLGEHNDACSAGARLRGLGERTGSNGAWAAGLLGGLQLARAAECSERFPPVWADAAASKRWRWVP